MELSGKELSALLIYFVNASKIDTLKKLSVSGKEKLVESISIYEDQVDESVNEIIISLIERM